MYKFSFYKLISIDRAQISDLDFHDKYIIYKGNHLNCSESREEYNAYKNNVKDSFYFWLYEENHIYVPTYKLTSICRELQQYLPKEKVPLKEISLASHFDFYDGYFVYLGQHYEYKWSKFRYNAFKKLTDIPQVVRSYPYFLYIDKLKDKLEECDIKTNKTDIKPYFSEKIMQIGVEPNIRIEMSGDFSFLKKAYQSLPKSFVRNFIDKGCDLNLLPLYILNLNTENITEGVATKIKCVTTKSFYHKLFGKQNIPDLKVKELLVDMEQESSVKNFVDAVQSSMYFSPITIDGEFVNFNLKIDFEELVQVGGSALKEKCAFKSATSSLLIDLIHNKILLFPGNKRRTGILFTYNTDYWQILAYFLYSFFSSTCRYKRSYLPLSILKEIGIKQMTKIYRYDDTSYVSGKWLPIYNKKNTIKRKYIIEKNKILT